MRSHRCTRSQQFFDYDVALCVTSLVTAILLRPCHSDPAACAQLPAEIATAATPRARPFRSRHLCQLRGEEGADLAEERRGFGRLVKRRELEAAHETFAGNKCDVPSETLQTVDPSGGATLCIGSLDLKSGAQKKVYGAQKKDALLIPMFF